MTRSSSALKARSSQSDALTDRISEVMRAAAAGDLEQRVIMIAPDDANAALAHDLNNLLDIVDAYVRESRASLEHVSDGIYYRRVMERGLLGSFGQAAGAINVATQAMADKVDGFKELTDQFRGNVMQVSDSLSGSAEGLEKTASGMAATMGEAKGGATAIGARADAVSDNVSGVATATEELTATIQNMQEQAQASNQATQDAVARTDETRDAMSQLAVASDKIGSVISVIQDVARQTNLLALNAMIEAVRVGAQGAGFMVVAEEVKALAHQTAEATEDVTTQVHSIQSLTKSAEHSMEAVKSTIDHMAGLNSQVTMAIAQQGEATLEISQNIHQAADSTRDVTGRIEGVAAAISEADDASQKMLDAAQTVSRQADTLQSELDRYLEAAAKAV